MKTYSPYLIAEHFIKKSTDSGIELTPMKLIKMCYISHGWALGFFDTPLLTEGVQAWKYGPVINTLYSAYKEFGKSQITEVKRSVNDIDKEIDTNGKKFLDIIWDKYKAYTGVQLSMLTHAKGTPWDTVWNRQKGWKDRHAEIPDEIIQKHYKELIANE